MLGWVGNIEQVTKDNGNFRTVLHTGVHSQLTVMSVPPGGEVGWEAHSHLDQFLRLEQGTARADFGESSDAVDDSYEIEDDWAVIVPAGVWHNVVNTGEEDLSCTRSTPRQNTPMGPCIEPKPTPMPPRNITKGTTPHRERGFAARPNPAGCDDVVGVARPSRVLRMSPPIGADIERSA
jgi:mannose-6-phosphate isomerase-like protein (cupin superfamily)